MSKLDEIPGAMMSVEGSDLVFHWEKATGAESYRVEILNPMLDTLNVVEGLTERDVRVPSGRIPGLAKAGSYLFQVQGVRGKHVIATTGLRPFSLP